MLRTCRDEHKITTHFADGLVKRLLRVEDAADEEAES